MRPAAPQGRGHGPLTRPQRPQASVMRCRGAFPPAPLTTEGDSLPSLARGGGEWWARSALLLVAARQIQRGVLSGALRLGGQVGGGCSPLILKTAPMPVPCLPCRYLMTTRQHALCLCRCRTPFSNALATSPLALTWPELQCGSAAISAACRASRVSGRRPGIWERSQTAKAGAAGDGAEGRRPGG